MVSSSDVAARLGRASAPRRLRAALLAAFALASGTVCRDQDATGPGVPVRTSLAVSPVYQTGATSGGPVLRLARVRARLTTFPGGPDTTSQVVDFTGDSAEVLFEVTLAGGASQVYQVVIDGIDAAGDTLFRGSDTVRAFPNMDVRPSALTLRYEGPDARVTAIALTPRDTTVDAPDSLRLRALVPEGPTPSRMFVGWTSRDTAALRVSDSGVVRPRSMERSVWVVAQLYNGVRDSTQVHIRAAVASVVLPRDTASVVRGDTVRLVAESRDSVGTVIARPVVWSALDTTVLVDATGLVRGRTARAIGRVVATVGSRADTATITVLPRPSAAVAIAPRAVTLAVGDSATITAAATDAQGQPNPDFPPVFASRSAAVATVSAAGVVRATGPGTTFVVATSGTATDSVPVTVSGGADLVVRSVTAADTSDRDTSPSVRVSIGNIGTATSSPFMVLFALRDSTTGTIVSTSASVMESSLAPGDSGVVAPSIAIPVDAHPFHRWEILVVADCEAGTDRAAAIAACLATPGPGGSIPEGNESNNSARRAITIRAPELFVANASATGAVAAGGSVLVRYDLRNTGGYAGVPVDVVVGLRDVVRNTVVGATSRRYSAPSRDLTISADTQRVALPADLVAANTHEVVVVFDCHDAGDAAAALTACLASSTTRSDVPEADEANNRVAFTYPPASLITSTVLSAHLDSLVSLGDTVRLTAQAYQGTTPVTGTFTWASRDGAIASVGTDGRVTALANGTTYVVVTEQGGTRDSALVVVRQRVSTVAISPNSVSRYLGRTQQFAASAVDARGNAVTFATFAWSSTAPSVVSVDSTGLATMAGIGAATVRATAGGITGQADVTVLSPITRIVVAPDSVVLNAFGLSQGYTATAYDTLNVAMSNVSFAWVSANPSVASLNAASGTATTATAVANGTTRIRATAQGVTGEALLTVRQALASVEVAPGSVTVAPQGRVAMTARGRDPGGAYLTNNPTFSWTSGNTSVFTVDASGVVTGVQAGQSALVTATGAGGVAGSATVFVSNTVPQSISFGRDTLKLGRSTSNSIPLYLSVVPTAPLTVTLSALDTIAYFPTTTATFPAGTSTINVTLATRNAGTTRVIADAANGGYGVDTAVVNVQANVRFSTTSVSMVATDQRAVQVILSDPAPANGVYVAFSHGTAGIADVSPDPVFIQEGLLASNVIVKGLSPGSSVISLSAAGVTGANTLTANVSAATLLWYYGPTRLGAGQYEPNANYLYLPQTLNYPLTVTLTSSDSTIARMQPQVVIPAGQGGVYVDARAFENRTGTVTSTASAPGWTPGVTSIISQPPKLAICCTLNLNTTSAPATFRVYAADSVGSSHPRINSLNVAFVSRDTLVATVDSATVIAAGQSQSPAITVRARNGGSTWIVATAGGHRTDSLQVNVSAPNLSLYYGVTRLGAGQFEPNANYAYIPNPIATPVTLTFTSDDSTVAKAIGPVIIPAGQTGTYFRIEGYRAGIVNYRVHATGYNSASQQVEVTAPRLTHCCNGSYPTYAAPATVTVYAADSYGNGHPVLTPLSVALTVPTTDTGVVSVDSASVTIGAGSSYNNLARVRIKNPGTGRVALTAAGYTSDTVRYTVDSANINLYYGTPLVAAGQIAQNGNYIYIPNARTDTVKIAVTNRSPGVASFPDTIRIPPSSGGVYFDWEGIAPGRDSVTFTSPGYRSRTAVFPISRRLLRGNDLPGALASTATPFTLRAFTIDTAGGSRPVRDTVTVRMISTDTTVLKLDSTYVHLVRGQQSSTANTARIVGVTGATPVRVIYQDSAGAMAPDTTNGLTVSGPVLRFYYGSPSRVGMRQVGRNVNYIYTDNAVTSPLTITLTSSNTNVLRSGSVTIPAGQNGTYFDVTGGDTLGLVRLTATATGYQLANLDVEVGQPQLIVSTNQNPTTTSPAGQISIYLADQVGTEHETTDNFTVTLVSTQPGVAAPDSTVVHFTPGMSRVSTPRMRYFGTGTTQLIVSDGRSAIYRYVPDTLPVTVSLPVVQAYYGPTSVGTGQITDNYVYVPNAPTTDTLRIAVRHNPALTTLPDTIKLPPGTSGVYYRAIGLGATGTDTITFSAPGHASSSTYLYSGPGRLALYGWPGSLARGDSVQVRIGILDPADGGKNLSTARTFTLSPNAFLRFRDGSGNTITQVTVNADNSQSAQFWVQAVSSGTGSVTVSGTGYTSAQFNTAIP